MTILLAAMALAFHAQDTSAPLPPEDVVVIGERMRRLKLATTADRKTGLSRCVFKRRSGDAAFDAFMCDALLTCAKTGTTRPQMEACLRQQVDAYARELAARRAQ